MARKKGGAGGPAAIMSAENEASAAKSSANDGGKADPAEVAAKDAECQRLNMLVKQRDNEIGILLNYLNKQKAAGGDSSVPVQSFGGPGDTSQDAVNSTQYSNNMEESKAMGQTP